MATTGAFLGNNLLLYLNGTAVALSRECSISISADEVDITTKSDAKVTALLPGRQKVTISASGLMGVVATTGYPSALTTLLKNGTAVAWKFSTATSADHYWHGATAYITSIELSAAENDAATYSISLAVSGAYNVTAKT